ncbi:MAG: hypothetical protein JWN74_3395 [Acidobacteriaceae bacterium]|nr:hypothetical protein [Acidobacteriaceae bacterium]
MLSEAEASSPVRVTGAAIYLRFILPSLVVQLWKSGHSWPRKHLSSDQAGFSPDEAATILSWLWLKSAI